MEKNEDKPYWGRKEEGKEWNQKKKEEREGRMGGVTYNLKLQKGLN